MNHCKVMLGKWRAESSFITQLIHAFYRSGMSIAVSFVRQGKKVSIRV
jgi:hypothetical protein